MLGDVKDQFRWTYLGYRFDWAQKDTREDLMTFAASEFIVPLGTGMRFLSATDTGTCCKPDLQPLDSPLTSLPHRPRLRFGIVLDANSHHVRLE